ncbi:hypothetical protein VULLAG_LOCUS15370 [Vulpes lagopus]
MECGCSAFIICPGQRNVPSDAPPLAGYSSLLSFSLGAQPFTSIYWKHFSRHSFREDLKYHQFHLLHILLGGLQSQMEIMDSKNQDPKESKRLKKLEASVG